MQRGFGRHQEDVQEMKKLLFASLAVCLAFAFAGCTPKEEGATGDTGAATPEATTNSAPENKGTGDDAAPVATLAKCDGCGAEMDKAMLTAHDGQNLCAKCIESHGH